MHTKSFLLPLWACGSVVFETYEAARQAHPEPPDPFAAVRFTQVRFEPRLPSVVIHLPLERGRDHHSETGEMGSQYRREPRSSAQTGGLLSEDDGYWNWYERNYVAPRSSGSTNIVFAPSSSRGSDSSDCMDSSPEKAPNAAASRREKAAGGYPWVTPCVEGNV